MPAGQRVDVQRLPAALAGKRKNSTSQAKHMFEDNGGESDGRALGEKNDSTAYIDWTKAKRAVFPNLKPEIGASDLRCY